MANRDIHATCKQLEEKRAKFRKNDKRAAFLGFAAMIAAMTTVILNANVPVPLDRYASVGIAGTITAIVTFYAYRYWHTAKKTKLSTSEWCLLFSYRTYDHLSNYVKEGLPSELEKALEQFKYLVTSLATRWDIGEKQRRKDLEDFDFIINPVVKLVLLLDNAYYPIIKKGDQYEIEKIRDYFMTLAQFFMNPREEKIGELFEQAPQAPAKEPEKEKPPRFFNKQPLIKHGIIVSVVAVVSGVVTFFLTVPYSAESPLPAIQTSFGAVAVVVAIYLGLVYILSKR